MIQTLERNLTRLEEFRMLGKDWNGYGAEPIPSAAIDRVISIIKKLSVQPEIFPTAKRSVQLEWDESDGDYLEFEVGEETLSMLFVPERDFDTSVEREVITERELFEEAEKFFMRRQQKNCMPIPVSVLRNLLKDVPQDAMVLLSETPSSVTSLFHLKSKKFFGKDAVFFCGYVDNN